MAGQAVAAVRIRGRLGGASAHVGATLLLGHRHAGGDAGLRGRRLQLRVVLTTGQQRLVDRSQLGVIPQRRNDGVGHRDGADMARLDGPHRCLGRSHHVRTRAVVSPRCGVHAMGDRGTHQLVVGRVVLHLIDPVPVSVVGMQDGPVAVCKLSPALGLAAGRNCPDLVYFIQAPLATLLDQSLDEHRG
ncbi:Uncharacterised protein [Mycobacterium tuberculosis]|nr:Uncharacterised protein [Mycobacterium tuberculosis]CKT16212.1 Uncharacterised protein [Mycobacterium tuberculosis]CNU57788.1 Uncharacterised protein [Mycobacterium tuberculosis]